jgi:predicted metal-dependent hydrolase
MNALTEIVQGKGFKAAVIRTNRVKTATVKVDEGQVSVVVPRRLSCEKVEALVSRKTRWIKEKLILQRDHLHHQPKEFISGESFSYLGRQHRLKLVTGPQKPVKLIGGRLQVQLPQNKTNGPQAVQQALQAWYEEHALTKLKEKSDRYAKILNVAPTAIGVRSYQSRWGSCSTKGDVTFNWRIIMAPNRIVDYVVVHELSHLKEHNHGPKFWKMVSRVIPDYLECKDWLKVNGRILHV